MKKLILISGSVICALFITMQATAQGVAVNTTGTTADASAIIDVSSNTQGMLVPRMLSTQRMAISSPANGLLVYQTDAPAGFYFYNAGTWQSLSGGAPSGVAGGDLTGTYPAPTLTTTGVTASTYGSSTASPVITVDSKGRITSATTAAISNVPGGTASGDLAGAYPAPTLTTTGVTASTYGSSTASPVITVDNKGRVTSATTAAISNVPGGAAGGDLTGTYPSPSLSNTTVTPGSYGTATISPTFTVDAKGRITGVTNNTISNVPGGTAGGDLAGSYPNPTIASGAGADVVTAINASTSAINAARLQNTVTTQGNTFNTGNNLVQLSSGKLPAVDGSQVTSLGAAHISGVIPAANLGTSSGSATTYLNGAGAFSAPTVGAGIPRVTYLIVPTSGAINYTVTDLTKSVFIFYFNGTAGPTAASTITLAPASSYPAGSLISFYEMSYNPAPSSNALNITSTSSSTQVIYGPFNANAVDISSGHSLTTAFNTNGACIKFMSDGVNSWYRFNQ